MEDLGREKAIEQPAEHLQVANLRHGHHGLEARPNHFQTAGNVLVHEDCQVVAFSVGLGGGKNLTVDRNVVHYGTPETDRQFPQF